MARTLFFALLLILAATSLPAQFVLNGGFEDTTITSNDTVPRHWSVDPIGTALTNDAHSGNQAIQLWNWYYYGRAWIAYGNTTNSFSGGGMPVSFNPDKLSGYYKYVYGNNGGQADSAICELLLFRNQGAGQDTLAYVQYLLGPSTDYIPFEVPIQYDSPLVLADSMILRFFSSISGFCDVQSNGICLYLSIDDLEISTITGQHAPLEPAANATSLFPSPSQNGFRVASEDANLFPARLEMYDLSGRRVFETTLNAPSGKEIEPHLPAGSYRWKIIGHQGQLQHGNWTMQ